MTNFASKDSRVGVGGERIYGQEVREGVHLVVEVAGFRLRIVEAFDGGLVLVLRCLLRAGTLPAIFCGKGPLFACLQRQVLMDADAVEALEQRQRYWGARRLHLACSPVLCLPIHLSIQLLPIEL